MKTILNKPIYLISLLCILLNSCESDDFVDPVDYTVEVRFSGDLEDFNYTLALDGYGENINQLFNPFDLQSNGSFFVTGDLNVDTTYVFEAQTLDGMSVEFRSSEFETAETSNMSINVKISKNNRQIADFTRSYEKSPSISGFTELTFLVSSTKETNEIACEGNHCPE